MNAEFDDIKALASARYGGAVAHAGEGIFSVAMEGMTVFFARLPGDPSFVLVRTKVLSLDDVPRRGAFARAALAGGFFWGGTRGATLSVGADDALYLTERRAVDELSDGDALDACLDEFALTAADWRERSRLYA